MVGQNKIFYALCFNFVSFVSYVKDSIINIVVFSELAPRPIQSISRNVVCLMCVCVMSPPLTTGNKSAGDFWLKCVLLKLQNYKPFVIPVLHGSIGGSRWDLFSGGKRVAELYGSIST